MISLLALSVLAKAGMIGTAVPLPRLVSVAPDLLFPEQGESSTVVYSDLTAGGAFNEVIASWNVQKAEQAAMSLDVRAHTPTGTTKWYRLGNWSLDGVHADRASVEKQKDLDGNVFTDTLHLAKPADTFDIQVTMKTLGDGPRPELKLLTLSFTGGKSAMNDHPVRSAAWGKVIDVPKRAQGDYPNGGVLCSATSTSMLLAHWAKQLNRPEIDRDVPDVVTGVWDKVYDGAGNWPFNTAFMGSFEGMRAYVSRLSSIADLEKWIAADLPIACSVDFDQLRGKPSAAGSGHVVVLVGFDENGDPIFNDPAKKGIVRFTYKRSDFELAWLYSNRTVYIVHPDAVKPPEGGRGMWIE